LKLSASLIQGLFPNTYQIVYQFTSTEQKTLDKSYTGHCRIYGPPHGTSFIPLFWWLEFGDRA